MLASPNLRRVEQLGEDVADPDAVLACVGVGLRLAGSAAALGDVELDGLAAGSLAHDRVVRAVLAEVDLRAVLLVRLDVAELADRWQVLLGEDRLAVVVHRLVVGVLLVAVGGDHAVAVGVDGLLVGPLLLGVGQALEVHLASGHDDVALTALDRVAVDVEHGRDAVVAAHLLQLLEGGRDQLRVDQPDARQRGRVGVQLELRELGVGRVVTDAGVLQVVGRPRRGDVLGDVRRFLVRLVGLHLEPLHQAWPDAAEQHRRDREQGDCDAGQQPRAPDDVGEEQHRADERDEHQDVLRRQHRMVSRVGHAGDQAAALRGQVEPVEPVVDPLQHQEQPEQRRELRLGRAGDPVGGGLEPDPAVQVVHDGGEHERGEQCGHREVDEEVQPREAEDVEADVLVEVRVGLAEVLAVVPQQEVAPLPGGGDTGEDAEDDAHPDEQDPAQRGHDLAVALEVGLLGRVRPEHGPEPEGEVEVDADDERHRPAEQGEQQDPRPDQLGEDRAVVEAVEPELVGPQPREQREGDHQGADDRHCQ